jgi:hypothetical protein
VLLGLALRLYGAASAGLTFDESIVWSFAREITAHPLRLVARTADHPLLNAYLVRASSLAFGETDLGLRILHACVGAATTAVVYRVGSALWGARAGLLAAALLAVDPFHVSWSRLVIEEAPSLLFEALALLLVFRALREERARDFAAAGLCVGLAYLAKETGLLLLPGLALGLIASERGRRALRTTGPWLGLLAAAAVVGLEMTWCRTHAEAAHLDRALAILGSSPGLTLKGRASTSASSTGGCGARRCSIRITWTATPSPRIRPWVFSTSPRRSWPGAETTMAPGSWPRSSRWCSWPRAWSTARRCSTRSGGARSASSRRSCWRDG